MTTHTHCAKASWPTMLTSTQAKSFWAECECGWMGPVVRKLETAERHADAHLVEVAR